MKKTLVFDIETHSAELLYSMPPEEFVRLIGYRWLGGKTVLTTDLEEIREQIRSARWIIGHNINGFDLPAVFGIESDEPLELTMQKRVYDTWTHAVLVHPAPYQYMNRHGKKALADTPAKMKKWFGLDEQAFQLGVPGKVSELRDLAYEFGDKSLPKKERISDGFGKIPLDDPRYREYLRGDVGASEGVAKALLKKGPLDDYALREQEIEARKAIISANGVRVDQPAAQSRVDELAARREVILAGLQEKYGFPTEGKAPWATTEGKEAILAALADYGIKPGPKVEWPRTPNGALQLGGEVLINLTKGTPAEELGTALAELKGQRSLAQLALDSVHPDGKAHPDISMLQRSGRWSTTKPGLTIWTARGEGAIEKVYFLPDNDDEVLLEFDYSNADARIVAALSGDRKYSERFEPGADGHLINAIAAWGYDTVMASEESQRAYRQKGKPLGHGWAYGGGPKGLTKATGVPLEDSKQFCDGMNATFRVLVSWQDKVRSFARRHGYVVNEWGRKMWIEKGREYTQAPALLGQNGTREIVCDALLRMPIHVLRRVKAQIHDALLFSVPKKNWEECRDYIIQLMETELHPKGGLKIEFPVGCGPAGDNWYEAAH
jgi:DNA polymerase-1